MSSPTELLSPFPAEPSGDSAENEPAATVTDLTIHEETYRLDSTQPTGSSPSLDDLWHRAYEHYGLMRPADVTEMIHVYRVILQSSRDQNACARSVTRTDPMSDPFQTLKRIIDEWWDLELDERDPSWMLSPVNSARMWSSTNDFPSPAYVLTRKGNSFVHMGFWKWYGDTDSGQPPLPFRS